MSFRPEVFDQTLRGGDLAAFVASAPGHLAEDQTLLRGKRRQPLQRRLVGKPVETAAQRLAIDGHGDPCLARLLRQRLARAASQRLLDARLVQTQQDGPQARVRRRPAPREPRVLAQPLQPRVNETHDRPVRVRPRGHRQDAAQQHMRQVVHPTLPPPGIDDPFQFRHPQHRSSPLQPQTGGNCQR